MLQCWQVGFFLEVYCEVIVLPVHALETLLCHIDYTHSHLTPQAGARARRCRGWLAMHSRNGLSKSASSFHVVQGMYALVARGQSPCLTRPKHVQTGPAWEWQMKDCPVVADSQQGPSSPAPKGAAQEQWLRNYSNFQSSTIVAEALCLLHGLATELLETPESGFCSCEDAGWAAGMMTER